MTEENPEEITMETLAAMTLEEFVICLKQPACQKLINQHVGGMVRAARIKAKMSLKKLGKESGLTWQQVQKYELGENRISAGRLKQFSEILKVDVGLFYEGLPHLISTGKEVAAGSTEGMRAYMLALTNDELAVTRNIQKINQNAAQMPEDARQIFLRRALGIVRAFHENTDEPELLTPATRQNGDPQGGPKPGP